MGIQKFNLKDGTYIRFEKIGKGNPLMLFHTFRNRLEYGYPIAEKLKEKFTVYLLDLPGFGDSPINQDTNYNQEFFTDSIVDFIKKFKLKNLTLAGESIGGVLPITVSIRVPDLIKKIYSFNPYDHDTKFGEGIGRGNFFAKFIMFHIGLPYIGSIFASLENKIILKNVMRGGFVNIKNLSEEYLNLLCKSIAKKGYVYHFRNVLQNYMSWSEAKKLYPKLKRPVELYYGQYSWANENDRNETKNLLGLKKFNILRNCKHFTFLENPKKISEILSR